MNKVEIFSNGNTMKVFIDGVEIKNLQSIKFYKDNLNPKSALELKFNCDLNPKEQPTGEAVPSVER